MTCLVSEETETLQELLREIRDSGIATNEMIGNALGKSDQAISDFIVGRSKRMINVDSWQPLANVLHVPLDRVLNAVRNSRKAEAPAKPTEAELERIRRYWRLMLTPEKFDHYDRVSRERGVTMDQAIEEDRRKRSDHAMPRNVAAKDSPGTSSGSGTHNRRKGSS